MFLQFSNDLHSACEPSARVWHKGNYRVGYHPVSIAQVVIDVNLREIRAVSLLHENLTVSRTILAALIVPLTTKS